MNENIEGLFPPRPHPNSAGVCCEINNLCALFQVALHIQGDGLRDDAESESERRRV
jgi:hypothetical protein